ncbi:MAG: Ig-like domain repeat protein [Candidatus Nanopelagicales bacterium]
MYSHARQFTWRARLCAGLVLAVLAALAVGPRPIASAAVDLGPRLVAEGLDGAPGADPIALGERVFWVAHTQTESQLWTSDGTTAGTRRFLTSLNHVGDLTRFRDGFLFTHDDGVHGRELWTSDGTVPGTRMVADLGENVEGNYGSRLLGVAGGAAFLAADDGVHGDELYRYTGSGVPQLLEINHTPKTTTVKDLQFDWREGWASASPDPIGMVGDSLYFSAVDDLYQAKFDFGVWYAEASGHGRELWKVGPAGKPTLVQDITPTDQGTNTDPNGSTDFDSGASVSMSGAVYFIVTSRQYKAELWRSDGSGASRVAADLPLSYDSDRMQWDFTPAVAGGRIYYPAWAGGYQGMWVTDGTGRGSRIGPAGYAGEPVALGNRVVFVLAGGDGWEPWVADAGGARVLRDLQPGPIGSYPLALTRWSGNVYFSAATSATGRDVWRTDGTAAGTVRVHDAPQSAGAYLPGPVVFLPAASRLFYLNALTDQRNTDLQLWELSKDNPVEAQSVVRLTVAPAPAPYGSRPRATVRVTGQGTPTGQVTLREGTRVLGSATLTKGQAVITLPADLAVGDHLLRATYSGDGSNKGAVSSAVALRVKARATLSGRISDLGVSTVDRIVVTGTLSTVPVLKATGIMTVLIDGRVLRSAKLTAADSNRLRFVIGPLPRGSHRLQVTFGQSPTVMDARTGVATIQVAPA